MVEGMKVDPGDTPHVESPKPTKRSTLEFTHHKTLWVVGWSTPVSVTARLSLIPHLRSHSRASYGTRDWSQDSAHENSMRHMQSAGTTREAIAILKNSLQQGITTESYAYVKVLQMCLNEKDVLAARQVNDCIIESGMDKDPYVANTLLNVYIRCGECLDARRVFNELQKKSVITWNTMIAAYVKSNRAESAFKLFNQMRRQGAQPNEVTYLSILKACTSPLTLKWGKEIHVRIAHSGLESDVRVGTALVHMYAKCGAIDDGRLVFDRMQKRDIVTWNTMIAGLSQQGYGHEAYKLFLQMTREGFEPDAITYVSMLNASANKMPLEWVKQVHQHAKKAGLESDLRVGNALVHMYVKSSGIDDARLTFYKMQKRSVVTWNIMINGLVHYGCAHEAYTLFLQMKKQGVEPDAFTYASILHASISGMPLRWVKEVHGHAQNAGLELDLRVGNALIHMYAKNRAIDDAQEVFDRMEKRDVVTWNTMIGGLAQQGCVDEAYKLFLQMRRNGFEPDTITYASILSACANMGALEWVKQIHSHARFAGLDSELRVGNALLHIYGKSGCIDDARLVFTQMERRDIATWNIMIGGLAQHGYGDEAYGLFVQMRQEGFEPDAFSYASILKGSASALPLERLRGVHDQARKAGLEPDLRVGNALVHMYAKAGCIDEARLAFERMEKRDVVTWNIMVGALAQHGSGREAYRLFLQMEQEGFKPNAVTYANLLNGSASVGALEWVKDVHDHACKAGLESDLLVGSAIIHMYAKSGDIDSARLVFNRMEKRDVVTWNTMIGGLAQHGCGHEALELFSKMNSDGVKPDGSSFAVALSACCHARLLDDGRRLFLAMTRDHGLDPDISHYTCIVDLLGRAGQFEEAKLFIRDMPVEPDEVTWKALLGACTTYGNVELGEVAAKELFKLEPNSAATYVLLSNIYAAAGNWDKASLVRTIVQDRAVWKEPGRSWIEVDNKIHEFVVADNFHSEAKAIYAHLKELTEKLKAEGYVPDTRLVLQNIDEDDKERALCSHSERLAICYGLMRIPRGKPIRVYKNLRVCSDCHTATKFMSRVTGREIIARDASRFHHFKNGVCSCGDYW